MRPDIQAPPLLIESCQCRAAEITAVLPVIHLVASGQLLTNTSFHIVIDQQNPRFSEDSLGITGNRPTFQDTTSTIRDTSGSDPTKPNYQPWQPTKACLQITIALRQQQILTT